VDQDPLEGSADLIADHPRARARFTHECFAVSVADPDAAETSTKACSKDVGDASVVSAAWTGRTYGYAAIRNAVLRSARYARFGRVLSNDLDSRLKQK
jgi:hypothetical protein